MSRRAPYAILLLMMMTGCRDSDSRVKALTGATLLDGTGAVVPDAVVIVDGATIRDAGPRGKATVPSDAKEIPLAGKFIVPGLIDVSTKGANVKQFLFAGVTSLGVQEGPSPQAVAPRLFPVSEQQAGFADLVIASQGSSPADTFRKIERMAKAEIDPAVILQAATKNGAAWLHAADIGIIAPGKRADLLVLDADPAKDARNLQKVSRILADGHWVERAPAK